MRSHFFAIERDKTFQKAWDAASNKNPKEAKRLTEKHAELCQQMRTAMLQETTSIKPR